jgi:hypothetical protein
LPDQNQEKAHQPQTTAAASEECMNTFLSLQAKMQTEAWAGQEM